VNGYSFFEFKLFQYPAQSALHTGLTHRLLSGWAFFSASAQTGEYPDRVSAERPVTSQYMKSGLRKGDVSVFGAFSAMNMDAHTMAVDIGDLEMQGLIQPETA